ncbi:HEPN domain-containing protein [Paraburkholderia sp. EG287B]|uniref:HEPN domain-containing protein n=1 Tax=Paraburkholderia sp. EG287B TaxID=3237010 RepID=UPI0034D237CB
MRASSPCSRGTPNTDSRQRSWLQRALQFQGEPSLKERLMKLITIVPMRFEAARVDDFTKRCAELRNDVAHFGGVGLEHQRLTLILRLVD